MSAQLSADIESNVRPNKFTFPAIFLFALALGFVGSLAIQLLNLKLHQSGAAGSAIGLSTAFQAAGILVGALGSTALMRFAGTAMLMSCGCVLAGASLLGLAGLDSVASITTLRFLMAVGTGAVLTTGEYVLMARAPADRRASMLAVYATFGVVGNASALATISCVGGASQEPLFVAAAIMFGLSLVPFVVGIRNRIEPERGVRNLHLLFRHPILFVPALGFGLIDGGLVELMNVYFVTRSFSVSEASAVTFFAFAGALSLQMPVALMSDQLGHRRVLTGVWLAIIVATTVIYAGQAPWLLAIAAFFLGGASDALYSVGFAALADRVPRRGLAAANGCFVASCGAGEIMGPLLAGRGLQMAEGAGFVFVFLLVGMLGLVLAHRAKRLKRPTTAGIGTDIGATQEMVTPT
jgi:MFS family permease